jgi:hypothetical protein
MEHAGGSRVEGLAVHIRNPDRTLVVVGYGVEWWSAWFLHTYVAQPEALRPEDWQKYETILFLEVKSGQVWLPGRGGPASFMVSGSVPGDSRPPRAGKGVHPQRPPLIPADAVLLHDGATLRLALECNGNMSWLMPVFPEQQIQKEAKEVPH